MSESEGLSKLAEYLKQTRRQAEAAIDHLNEQIAILNRDNVEKEAKLQESLGQIGDLKRQISKMQEDKSVKAVFKERDDWKSLVDSIQKDRGRLQLENAALHQKLEDMSTEMDMLKQQVQSLQRERESLVIATSSHTVGENGEGLGSRLTSGGVMFTPIKDSSGREIAFPEASPHTMMHRLKEELKRIHRQMEEERKQAAAEQIVKMAEINRLKSQLHGAVSAQSTPPSSSIAPYHSPVPSSLSWIGSILGFYSVSDTKPKDSVKTTYQQTGGRKRLPLPVPRVLKV